MSKWLLISICLGISSLAHSADLKWDVEWYNSGRYTEPTENLVVNPGGRRISTPTGRAETDLRFNTRLTFSGGARLVVRPQLVGTQEYFAYSNPSEEATSASGKASLPEAYFEKDLTPKLSFAIGLQNYQWGPAEFLSPSNPFYHFNSSQRAYNYKEPGKNLLRFNWSPSASWSGIAVFEPVDNGNAFWVENRTFTAKGLLKIERRGKNSLNYVGLDSGVYEEGLPFIGEYANYEVLEGLSMYFDGRQSRGSAQYEPEYSSGLMDMVYEKDLSSWNSLIITGVRFESRVDVRFEYIFNSFGLSQEDQVLAFSSALPQHPRGNQNLKRILRSGRELLGLHYAYASIRVPDFIRQSNSLSLRYFHSLMDHSGGLQLACDFAIGDAWTLFAELGASVGDANQELSAFERGSLSAGFKWNL